MFSKLAVFSDAIFNPIMYGVSIELIESLLSFDCAKVVDDKAIFQIGDEY